MPAIVPPIKCQGIKTKLIPTIRSVVGSPIQGRWIEPFCGSCVVAFNLQPQEAILTDTNQHVIQFYQSIQKGLITPETVREYLAQESQKLLSNGADYYYSVRDRFNQTPNDLDFLFLNRACFNGLIRFNQKGQFNVPFCRKPQRFAKAYITKIVNQVRGVKTILDSRSWVFQVADFAATLATVQPTDFVYADPPYMGRHVDYFNTWTQADEAKLMHLLHNLPCRFALSTWLGNKFRSNPSLQQYWSDRPCHIIPVRHFYHIGAAETLRHPITEALVTN